MERTRIPTQTVLLSRRSTSTSTSSAQLLIEKLLAVLKKPTISACAYKTHMIGRFNDVAKLKKANYKCHPQYDFPLTSRLLLNKNVREMRQSSSQAIGAEED